MLFEVEEEKTVVASKLKLNNSVLLLSLGGSAVAKCSKDKIEKEQFQVQPQIAAAEKRFEQ